MRNTDNREMIMNGSDNSAFKGRVALVVGMGISGLGAAHLLKLLGAEVRITDSREEDRLMEQIMNLPEGILIETGKHTVSMLDGVNLVILSPGVPASLPLVQEAYSRGIEVIGELELAYRVADNIPWIAITGTNGKSTTTTLIDLMLKGAGYNVITGGNIGTSLSETMASYILAEKPERIDYIVAEVSSFQLEGINTFRPSIGMVLNISPDHLDRYRDMQEYIDAKKRIMLNMTEEDRLILNLDDPIVKDFSTETAADLWYFSRQSNALLKGAYVDSGYIVIKQQRIIPVEGIGIKGLHNIENALAAGLCASLAGVDSSVIANVLRRFRGLEHRMEFVEEVDGVSFYNDSKGTNIGSVIKSLEGFEGEVVLILGGSDKGSDFTPLIPYLRERVRAVVAMGETKEKILSQLGGVIDVYTAEDMSDAVKRGYALAGSGGTVLLSPGCASFDMFENFEHRGRVFKEEVRRLKAA